MFYENYSGHMMQSGDDYKIIRPNGTTDYLFLHFPIPMHIILDGIETVTKNNACILFCPGEEHTFYAKTKFLNSFVHFDSDIDIKTQFSLKTKTIFYPDSPDLINMLIKQIHTEVLEKNSHSFEMINSYITQLLILTERSFESDEYDELKQQFIDLRISMLSDYKKPCDINSLAKKMCLSRSRFYDYYKLFFCTSPKQDLLNMRMEAAHTLLSNKSKTTAEIAKDVGFENVEHFTRYYKKHFGVSPRRNNKSDK